MDMKAIFLGLIAVVGILVYSSTYTVDQRETAIRFKFGEISDANIGPGLHFKAPFMHTVKKFSSQIITLDANPERFLTGEKKYVLVDFVAKWRISDIGTFFRATGGGRYSVANSRIEDIMKDGLRNQLSRRTVQEALSDERTQIMQGVEDKANEISSQLGIEIVDVRVSKIDFPDQVSEAVYQRMRSERQRIAQDFRSRGQEQAEKIRAAADRESTVIMAEAYRDSETIRGDGDAQAADIYAKAYGQDTDFYTFYRSLEAYRNTLGKNGDMMVLEPDSEFFRYFKQKSSQPSQSDSSGY